jgi:hypothetical protein
MSRDSTATKPIPFLCRLGFHVWGKWGEAKPFGYSLYQRRTCLECGFVGERECGHAIKGYDYTLTLRTRKVGAE